MKVEQVKLADLKRPERNVRIHSDKQLAEFKRSVEMFGQIRPIVIDENNVMLAGNGLYETLLSMGKSEADCYRVKNLSESQKKKLMLADNRVYSLGVDDIDAFDAIIAELGNDYDIPGYDEDLIKTLLSSTPEVDDMLNEYGTFTEASINNMQRHAEKENEPSPLNTPSNVLQPTVTPPQPSSLGSTTSDEREQERPLEGRTERCIVCPNCGSRIPL